MENILQKSCGKDLLKITASVTETWFVTVTASPTLKFGIPIGICDLCKRYAQINKNSAKYKEWIKTD